MKHVSMRTLRCSQQEAWWPNKLRCKRKYTLKYTGEPVNTFWENDQGHEFWLIWGPKMDPKLDLGGSYSTHRWKYLQWACEAILMWSQWKPFEKVTKVPNFYLLGFQNGPKNWAFKAWKYLQWTYKARMMWIQRKLFNEIFENLNFESLIGPKWPQNLGLWGLSFTHQLK